MLINSTVLMYRVFLSARHTLPQTGMLLNLLNETLETVLRCENFEVHVPRRWLIAGDDYSRAIISASRHELIRQRVAMLQAVFLRQRLKSRPERGISERNRRLFSLVYIGSRDMQRLWLAESKDAVRTLGYALHIIPALLRTPNQFDAKSYLYCFRIISPHWDKLSLDMQEILCDLMGFDLALVPVLINSPDFWIKW